QRFSLFKTFKKAFPLLAAKANERRHDLDAFRRVIVPVGKGLAAMGRLNQTDTSAPCNHLGSLLVCSALTTTEKTSSRAGVSFAIQVAICITIAFHRDAPRFEVLTSDTQSPSRIVFILATKAGSKWNRLSIALPASSAR